MSTVGTYKMLILLITILILLLPSEVNGVASCKTLVTGSTDLCQECESGFTLLLYSRTKTICATVSGTTCTIDATNYATESTDAASVAFKYYAASGNTKAYCYNCADYFSRSRTGTLCDQCSQTTQSTNFYLQSVYSNTQGCFNCAITGYKQQTVEAISHIGLNMRECLSSSSQSAVCTYTQFYDTSSSTCKECTALWPNCASCTSNQCLTCPQGFYYHSSAYDATTGTSKAMCVFNVCPQGQCKNPTTNLCVTSSLSDCQTCKIIDVAGTATQTCEVCKSGYLPVVASGASTCQVLDKTTTTTLRYYIKGGAPVLSTAFTTLAYNFQTQTGLTPATSFLFIQEALTAIHMSTQSTYTSYTDAYIYLGAGDHYLFACDGDETTTTYPSYSTVVNYCDPTVSYEKLLKHYAIHDNVRITVQPMYCSFAESLGYTGDTAYSGMCQGSGKATIYVNNANAQFNITGKAIFQDIKFSGINAYAVPSTSTHDLSVWPVLYCAVSSEPTGYDTPLRMSYQSNANTAPFGFSCGDAWHSAPVKIDKAKTSRRCLLNNYAQFYPSQESTLSCPGEPSHSTFFTQSTNGAYSKRRFTLFNLYAFPDYQSIYKAPPSITINTCDFEYFLGNYESLIHVENNNLNKITQTTTITLAASTPTDTKTFYTMNNADKGAYIYIKSSSFKHSRFCKGMIVYRKGWTIYQKSSFTNYNTLFSLNNNKDTGSSILITDSTFLNLNALTKVNALAIYGGTTPTRALSTTTQIETVYYPAFIHKGIVMNVEDFGGIIEVANSNFQKNFHFIPEAVMTTHSTTDTHSIDQFKDSFTTQEYKLASCNTITKLDQYFFHTGVKPGDDMDALFDQFERLGLIYISRNRYIMLFRGNRFLRNIGTFGGAITINSPDWKKGAVNKPYFVSMENIFTANIGYFSGNAIYIRNTQKTTSLIEICAGSHIESSSFDTNVGLKAHNGGAIAAVCQYLSNSAHDDWTSTSSINSLFSPVDLLQDVYDPLTATIDNTYIFNVLAFKFAIQYTNFTNNYSGQKGTAVYIKQMSKVRLVGCKFDTNGPVYSLMEQESSPYVTYLSNRPITFVDPLDSCYDEFNFMNECDTDNTYVDWPMAQGALHIHFCQETYCMNENSYQFLTITSCDFVNNDAGPILDTTQATSDMASSLYISGGFSNKISKTKFRDHIGNYDFYATSRAPRVGKHFPSLYFQYQHVPIIRMKTTAPVITDTILNFTTQFNGCSFYNNKHVNVLGLPSSQQFQGSLIQYTTNYYAGKYMLPTLQITSTSIRDNKFLGNDTSLIYLTNGQLIFTDNTVYGNGYLQTSYLIQKAKPADVNIYFLYDAYTFYMYQMYGVINLNGQQALPAGTTHQILRNTFAYCVAYQGSAIVIRVDNQLVLLQSNNYVNNYAVKGAALYAKNSNARTTLRFISETVLNQFSLQKGAFVFESDYTDMLSFTFTSSIFRNCWAQQGGAINGNTIAFGIIQLSVFNDDLFVANKTAVILSQFSRQTWAITEIIENNIMQQLTDRVVRNSGPIYLSQGYNSKAVVFTGTTLKSASDPYLTYSEIIDCSFINLTANQASGVFIGAGISVRIRNTPTGGNRQFLNCSHSNYGVINVQDGGILLGENLIFTSNYASSKGAVLSSALSTVVMQNCTFTGNRAYDKGIIYLLTDSYFVCNQCSFVANTANDSSTIFALNNLGGRINITNSYFFNNSHTQNLMNLIYSPAYIYNTSFIDNIARVVNNGITLISSTLTAQNMTVNYTNKDFLSTIDTAVDTGFFSLSFQSILQVSSSWIENCRGSTAAVLYASGSSSVYFDTSSTITNCKSLAGNVFHFTLTNVVRILSTRFIGNSQIDIYLEKGAATIQNTTFQGTSKNSIWAQQANLTVVNSTFRDAANQNTLGKGIYCKCNTLLVDQCIFSNLTGLQGGGIYLTSNTIKSSYTVRFSSFLNNTAMHGGAIKVADAASLAILSNQFMGNKASLITPPITASSEMEQKGMGGALNLDCFNQDVYLQRNCTISISQTNKFSYNSASHDGGALTWLSNRYIDDGTNTFTFNSAPYGDDIASYPQMFVVQFLDNNDYFNPQNESLVIPSRRLEFRIDHQKRLLQDTNPATTVLLILISLFIGILILSVYCLRDSVLLCGLYDRSEWIIVQD